MLKNLNKIAKMRQPVKKRLSLLAAKIPTVTNFKKNTGKRFVKSSKKPFITGNKKTVNQKARQSHVMSLPLGKKRKLALVINHIEHPTNKSNHKKRAAKKLPQTQHVRVKKNQQSAFTAILLIAGLCGVLFFGMQAIASPIETSVSPPIKTQKPVKPPKEKQSLPRSSPVTLRIPAIELNTALTTIGMAQDGTIEVPEDYTKAGWYRLSPTPGEVGPAIIVGHLDNINGQAVFWRLQELVPGQMIEIDREDGKTAKFIIEKLKQVPQNDSFPTEEVYGNTDRAALRLITCSGTFNHFTQRYSDNTVVFASLVSGNTIPKEAPAKQDA